MKNNFTFFYSYYEAVKELPEEEQGQMYKILVDYAMTGIEQKLSGSQKLIFILAKPNLDKSVKQAQNGSKNGAQQSEVEEEKPLEKPLEKPNESQTKNQSKANSDLASQSKDKDKELDMESKKKQERKKTTPKKKPDAENTILADGELDILIDKSFTDPDVRAKFRDYANMRAGMGKNKAIRTRATFDGCISKIRKFAKTKQQAIDILDESITNNWTGLFELKSQSQSVEEVPFAN